MAQRWGGRIEEIHPGDVIWFPPREKHWHGAASTTAMTHIAIQEQLNGKTVDWMEKVGDEQYRARQGDVPMTQWTSDELNKIGKTEELDLASMRRDGTLTKPVTIWVVRLGDDLYVRPIKGRTGPWFRGTQVRHEGQISAGRVDKDVTFADADPHLNDQIDAAYRAKYHRYAANIVNSVLTPQARAGTIKLVPR